MMTYEEEQSAVERGEKQMREMAMRAFTVALRGSSVDSGALPILEARFKSALAEAVRVRDMIENATEAM